MKFTQRTLITACVIVGISLVGAKLSLNTMEEARAATTDASKKSMPRLGRYAWARIENLNKRFALELVQKLQSKEALDDFRDHGTVDGKSLDQLVTNGWALEFLKPAMAGLVYPFDGKVQILNRHTDWTDWAASLAFSPDGKYLAIGSVYGTLHVWTLQVNGTWRQSQVLTGHIKAINFRSVAFSPDGTHLASGSHDHTVCVWTLQTDGTWGQHQVLTGHTEMVTSVAFSPDGKQLASSSAYDNTVRVWTLQTDGTWGEQPQVLTDHWVRSVAFSPDGNYLATGSIDSTVRVWSLQTNGTWGQLQELLGHTASVNSVAFSPDGNYLATGSSDRTVRLWKLQADGTWGQLRILTCYGSEVLSVAFSLDGKYLAAGTDASTLGVCTLQVDGTWGQHQVLSGHRLRFEVFSIAFSPNSKSIASGSQDTTVRVWTQIDLVGKNNVAEKIMLLQLLNREGKDVFKDRLHLQAMWLTFDIQARSYLTKKYTITLTMRDRAVAAWGWVKRLVE